MARFTCSHELVHERETEVRRCVELGHAAAAKLSHTRSAGGTTAHLGERDLLGALARRHSCTRAMEAVDHCEKKNRVVKQTVSCKTCKEGRPASACTGPGRGGAVGVILTHDRGASRRRSTSGIRVCALSPAFARPLSRYRFLLRRVRFGRHTTDALGTHASTHSRARCRSIFRPHILRARAGRLKRLSWRHNAASADQPAGGMRAALCLARRRRLRPLCVCAGGWPGSGCEASRWNMPTASAPHHHACGEARPGGHAGDDGKEEDD